MNIDRLKEIRLDRDLLQRDVAEAIGIKRQQYRLPNRKFI